MGAKCATTSPSRSALGLDSKVDGSFQAQPLLDIHFDRAIEACEAAQLIELGPFVRLLARAATQSGR